MVIEDFAHPIVFCSAVLMLWSGLHAGYWEIAAMGFMTGSISFSSGISRWARYRAEEKRTALSARRGEDER